MFLSWQTLEGIEITIFLLMEVVKYLLEQGMSDFYNSDNTFLQLHLVLYGTRKM